MPRQKYTAGEAARRLGISLDTLRRWDREGRIRTTRDKANRRLIAATEIDRLRERRRPRALGAQSFLRHGPRGQGRRAPRPGRARGRPVPHRLGDHERGRARARARARVAGDGSGQGNLDHGRAVKALAVLFALAALGGSRRDSRSRRAHGVRRGVADRGLPADRPLAALQLRRLGSARAPDSPGRTGGCLRRRQPEASPTALPRRARLQAGHVRHEQVDRARAEVEPRAHRVGVRPSPLGREGRDRRSRRSDRCVHAAAARRARHYRRGDEQRRQPGDRRQEHRRQGRARRGRCRTRLRDRRQARGLACAQRSGFQPGLSRSSSTRSQSSTRPRARLGREHSSAR